MFPVWVVCLGAASVLFEVTEECSTDQFQCFDNSCIRKEEFCDFKYDCPDKSDEVNCFRECLIDSYLDGYRYKGNRNITKSGIPCQRWGEQFPHAHKYITMVQDDNFCRNPDFDGGPWCYTMDKNVKWEYCQIPDCGVSFDCKTSAKKCNWRQPLQMYGYWKEEKIWQNFNEAFIMRRNTSSTEPKVKAMLVSPPTYRTTFGCFSMFISTFGNTSFDLEVFVVQGTEMRNSTWNEHNNNPGNQIYINIKENYNFAIIIQGQFSSTGQVEIAVGNFSYMYGTCPAEESFEYLFKCKNGETVDTYYFCDGYPDCSDRSDEENCHNECLPSYDKSGMFYGGKENRTTSNHVCERWDLDIPYNNTLLDIKDENYCRHIDNGSTPGCYTNKSGHLQFEICSIPPCPISYCEVDEHLCWNGLCMKNTSSNEMKEYCYTGTFKTYNNTSSSCPGHISCRGNTVCIKEDLLCNGIPDCPYFDDEIRCNSTCPEHCVCRGLYLKCNISLVPMHSIPKNTRALDLSGSAIAAAYLENIRFPMLQFLNLSRTELYKLSANISFGIEMKLKNLQILDISFNGISTISRDAFRSLHRLKQLYLDGNSFTNLGSGTGQIELVSLEYLSITQNFIYNISKDDFLSIPNLKTLNISSNKLTYIQEEALYVLTKLTNLVLKNNNLRNESVYFTGKMTELELIDLSYNSLSFDTIKIFNGITVYLNHNLVQHVSSKQFSYFAYLVTLDLSFNQIKTIEEIAFSDMYGLQNLNLESNLLQNIQSKTFNGLGNLRILKLSSNHLTTLDGHVFARLGRLEALFLQKNNLTVYRTMFEGLYSLKHLYVDSFTICCAKPQSVSPRNCFAPKEYLSSCDNLISNGILSVCIWFNAVFALVGNIFVIIFRCKNKLRKRKSSPQLVFVLNLSFSDLLMGVYLSVIAITNIRYRGVYGFVDYVWRNSHICTISGILATVSSESSAMFILLITLERFLVLRFPFSFRKMSVRTSVLASGIVWLVSFILAFIPVILQSTFKNKFYSMSSVCISLPLTTKRIVGWEYSVTVFIGFNFILFLGVILGQILIFKEVRRIGNKFKDSTRSREAAVAKSLILVALTDSLCWIPIAVIGLITTANVEVSSQVYSWIIVLVLPINSAINPFLYTFLTMRKRKHAQSRTEISQDTACAHHLHDVGYLFHRWVKLSSYTDTMSLDNFLISHGMTVLEIFNVTLKVVEDLISIHERQYTHAHISGRSVIISTNDQESSKIKQDNVFLTFKQTPVQNKSDQKADINALGLLIRNLIETLESRTDSVCDTKL